MFIHLLAASLGPVSERCKEPTIHGVNILVGVGVGEDFVHQVECGKRWGWRVLRRGWGWGALGESSRQVAGAPLRRHLEPDLRRGQTAAVGYLWGASRWEDTASKLTDPGVGHTPDL